MAQTINADNGVISGSTGLKFTADTTGILALQNNGTTSLTIDTSGNVGIGTSSPISNSGYGGLSVNGTSGAIVSLMKAGTETGRIFTGGDETSFQCKATTGYITFFQGVSGGAERMRIDSSGNVNIGGATPDAGNTLRYLDIYNTNTGASAGSIIRLVTSNVAASGNITVDIVKYKNGQFSINNNETNAAAFTSFNVGSTERMRIASTGKVGIGVDPGRSFHVKGSDNWWKFEETGGTGRNWLIGTGTSTSFRIYDETANLDRFAVDSSGNVGIGTTSPSSYGLLTVLSTTAGSAKINIMDNSAGSAAPLLQFGMNHSNGFNTADAARIWTTATASNIASLNFAAYNTAAPSTAQMVLNAGNVGINGTPTYKLDVGINNQTQSATVGSNGLIRNATAADQTPFTQARIVVYGGTSVDTGNWGYLAYGSDASMRIVYGKTGAGAPLLFGTTDATNGTGTFTERMRISMSGVVTLTNSIYHTAATAVTAAGSTQGTATALTSDINNVTTGQIVSGLAGVRLPTPAAAGLRIFIRNGAAATPGYTMKVWPHVSGNISGVGVDVGIDVDATVVLEFIAFDTTNWYIPSAVLA